MNLRPRRPRAYRMGARAEAAAETHQKIIGAALRLVSTRLYDEISLADVAREAGVTVQTVLRRFGSKDALTEVAAAAGAEEVRRTRASAPVGDVTATMRVLAGHYEEWGDRSIRFLSQEQRSPAMRHVTDGGRALHYEWVEQSFAPQLAAVSGTARARLRAQLIAATDVYVWKILRRDLGFDARATEQAMRELVTAVLP